MSAIKMFLYYQLFTIIIKPISLWKKLQNTPPEKYFFLKKRIFSKSKTLVKNILIFIYSLILKTHYFMYHNS